MLTSILPPRRSTLRHAAAFCVGALAAIAHAQSTAVIPPAAESTAGNTGDQIPLGDIPGGSYQVIYAPSQLGSIPPGSVITGLQIRRNSALLAPWPAAALTIGRFDISLGSSNRTPATATATFEDNIALPVLVRSGPLQLAAGAYPGGPAGTVPKAFGPVIPFSTGYVYRGGPLVVLFRVQNADALGTNFADIFPLPGEIRDIGNGGDADATDGLLYPDTGVVLRLTFTPPPADLAKGVTKVTVGDQMVASSAENGVNLLTVNFGITQTSTMGADQFDTIGPGSEFVGLSHRLFRDTAAAWPAAPVSFTDFNIQLSRSNNPPGMISDTFANNVGADAVTVRSGPLAIPVGALLPSAGQPVAPFSLELPFSAPYSYRGGPVYCVERQSGRVGGASTLFEASGAPVLGWGSAFESRSGLGFNATTTNPPYPKLFLITRYSVDAGTSSPLNQLAPAPGGFPAGLSNRLQWVISADELRYIPVGSVIDSLWLRQLAAALAAAPDADTSALDFEIALSSATVSPGSMSNTFANNIGADRVVVHDGPLAIAANTLPPGTKGTFGKVAQFQRQFVYKGGPLCIDIRHTGPSTIISTLDAVQNTTNTNRILISSNPDAVAGSFFGGTYKGIAVKLGYIPSVISPNNLATGISFADWYAAQQSNYSYQLIIPASQLRSVDVGSAITGMSFRRATSQATDPTPFPDAEITVPRFDVSLSAAERSPLSISNTFAENIGMDEVLARSGPLTIPANAFPASGVAGQPSDNAWYINFDRGYVYQGGDLCVTVRGVGQISGSGLFEGTTVNLTATGAAIYNYGSADATSGLAYGPIGVRFAFTPRAFCPADLNNDGVVDDQDFQIFVVAYNILDCADGSMPFGCPSDLNFDRVVDDLDFQAFLPAYNTLICP
ncbi:MAG: hypothetical protein U0573_11580 [Phycisphaerales bacterium]|nr:hypothetical protein [Planctomycetota bacterium]